jgi:hypothetical protein
MHFLRVEHERRVVRHQPAELGFVERPRAGFEVGLDDAPLAVLGNPQQALPGLLPGLGVLPKQQHRDLFERS